MEKNTLPYYLIYFYYFFAFVLQPLEQFKHKDKEMFHKNKRSIKKANRVPLELNIVTTKNYSGVFNTQQYDFTGVQQ